MKQHIRMFSVLLILTFLLVNCESEEVYLKDKQHQVDNNRVKLLKGDKAKKILYQLNSKLSGLGSPALNNNIRLRTNGQSIDFNSILQVIDTLGIKNYTFRISNHPDDDYKTFHNLVVTDKGTEIETTLMKYEMTEQFAAAYNQSLKLFQQFEGKVTATGFSLSPLSPVPCEEIVKEFNPIPVYDPNTVVHNPGGSSPSSGGGSGGSFGGAGTGNGSGSGTGSGGGSSNGATCLEAIARIFCSCGRNYGSLGDYAGSICGDWETNPGYEVYLGFIYVASNNCRLAADPCNPDGVIGILEPTKSTPCDELKLNSSNTVFKEKMALLKNSVNDTIEKTFPIYNGNHAGDNYTNPLTGPVVSGTELSSQVIYHISLKATAHNHLTDPGKRHVGTFSPTDILEFFNLITLAEENQSPITKEEFTFYLVCNEGNYALKITDFEKLETFAMKILAIEAYKEDVDRFYKRNKMVHGEEKAKQNIGFLKLMKKYDIGVDYYEADENFENWKKLELNSSENNINKIPCN